MTNENDNTKAPTSTTSETEPTAPSPSSEPAALEASSSPTDAPAAEPKSEPEPSSSTPEPSTSTSASASTSDLPSDLKTVHSSPTPRNSPIAQDDAPQDPAEREKLLDQAVSFLETGQVLEAPDEEKQQFLESKGLSPEEAQTLIGRINGAKRRKEKKGKRRERERMGQALHTHSPDYTSQLPPPPQPQQQLVQQVPVNPNPTIVTYPEWLAPPPPAAPRPLVSGATLGKAAYFGLATAATVYGANKLIVTPMLDALTASRLDFSATVKKNLDELTTRLLDLAPTGYASKAAARKTRDEDEESEVSDVSDPSELFHVDAQTQTDASLLEHGDDDAGTGAMTPDSKLEELTSQMKVLVESHSDGTDNELTFLLEDLTSYLEGLTYDSAVSSNIYASPFGGFGQQMDKDKDDPILKVKQEIRSVKGVLLNTKNFPASR